MPIRAGEGYFNSNGVIKTDALTSSKRQATSQNTSTKVDSTIKDQAASTTLTEVAKKADAAVVQVSSRMNARNTSIVDMNSVSTAVTDAVNKGMESIAKRKGETTTTQAQTAAAATEDAATTSQYAAKTTGGSYQNTLIENSNRQLAAQTAAAKPTQTTAAAPQQPPAAPPPQQPQAAPPPQQQAAPPPPKPQGAPPPSDQAGGMGRGKGPERSEKENPEGRGRRVKYQDQIIEDERKRKAAEETAAQDKKAVKEKEPEAAPAVQPGFESIV